MKSLLLGDYPYELQELCFLLFVAENDTAEFSLCLSSDIKKCQEVPDCVRDISAVFIRPFKDEVIEGYRHPYPNLLGLGLHDNNL